MGIESRLLRLETADRAIAVGVAAFAIVHPDASVQFHSHRFRMAHDTRILIARSSRDIAIAVDIRDGAASADGTVGLCRRLTDSVGKGLGVVSVAFPPEVGAFAGPVRAYAGIDARISLMSAARASHGCDFEKFDVVLATEEVEFAAATMLAIPMVPRPVYVYG